MLDILPDYWRKEVLLCLRVGVSLIFLSRKGVTHAFLGWTCSWVLLLRDGGGDGSHLSDARPGEAAPSSPSTQQLETGVLFLTVGIQPKSTCPWDPPVRAGKLVWGGAVRAKNGAWITNHLKSSSCCLRVGIWIFLWVQKVKNQVKSVY